MFLVGHSSVRSLRHPTSTLACASKTLLSRYASSYAVGGEKKPDASGEDLLEQKLKMLDMIERRGLPKGMDSSQFPFDVLDHHIPAPLSQYASSDGPIRGFFNWISSESSNYFSNAFNLFLVARQKPFLGITNLPTPKRRWSPRVFGTKSLSSKSWLAPLRQTALETYIKMNESQSLGDLKTLGEVTRGRLYEEAHRRTKNIGRDKLIVWKCHGEASPTRVLSIRTMDLRAMTGSDRKQIAMAQVLVKLDTLQSLTIYHKKTGKLVSSKGTPEDPIRITEYMVFERRLLSPGNWYLRDQLYPGSAVERVSMQGL